MLDHGADIHYQDKDKDTPLHWAVYGDKLEAVKLLIQRGADKNLANRVFQTPLNCAKDFYKISIVDYLSSLL